MTLLFAAVLALMVVSCGVELKRAEPAAGPDPLWVEATLSSLSLEEKAAQMVFTWTLSPYVSENSREWLELERLARDRKLGGFIFSLGEVYAYAAQINKLQRLAEVPLLIGVDFEWGPGMRIKNSTTFPRAMAIGATREPDYAYRVGKATALESRALGVHHNYAPDVDVNSNARNPVINTRAFGDNVELVSQMGAAFIRGSQEGGMIATAKHFPGHGDTDIDTHLKLMQLESTRERLEAVELKPFQAAIDSGVLSVMVGHIAVPALDTAAGIPATVSPLLVTRLLKEEMGFEGLIVTDAMVMHGVSSRYHVGESTVLAVKAGVDLVLMPEDPDIAINAIVGAVRRGELSEDRIDHSVRKLLEMKQWIGLDRHRMVDLERVSEVVSSPEHRALAKEIAQRSITVLGNATGLLPLSHTDTSRILNLVIADTEDPEIGQQVHRELLARHPRTSYERIDPHSNREEYDTAFAAASRADIVMCQLHFYTRSGQMTGFIPDSMRSLIKRLVATGKRVVAVSFGNPYVVSDFPEMETYVCAYSSAEVVNEAVVEVLFGEHAASGKLPIDIPGLYRYGDGVEYPKTALRTGEPAEVGIDPRKLAAVDELVLKAVRDSAFPGAVLLVARDGVIVHERGYGSFEYGPSSPLVSPNAIYDLASVTKVIATTSAVMRLLEEKKLSLDDPVARIIPQFAQAGKERITLYNLMVHNSGLPAWRTFYNFCETPQCVLDSVYATPLIYATGDSTLYSDLGLITMGKVVEAVTGTSLDRYVDSVFFKPLGMRSTFYNPPPALLERVVPTEVDTYWKNTGVAVRGRVHDENAATLGGVSGHAGLFSTASDLTKLLQMLLNGGIYDSKRFLKAETIKLFTTRQSESSTRAIGWDTRGESLSFSGDFASPTSYLHTGFTGTSVLVDPEQRMIVVLLTNRVHPRRSPSKMHGARVAVHNAVYSALGDKPE